MTRDRALQIFDGVMLSDGGLIRYRGGARYHMGLAKPAISMTDHLKYEQWISDNVFAVLGIPVSEGHPRVATRSMLVRGKPYQYALLQTRQSLLLADLYDEWYSGGEWVGPEYGKYIRGALKVLPERLMKAEKLPTLTLAHWFLGDGGSSLACPRGYPQLQVTFSTNCFTEEEVYHLMAMLSDMGVTTVKPLRHETKKGSGLQIWLSTAGSNTDHFMDLVEPHVLEIFDDSGGPSYRDMIERKTTFIGMRLVGKT